MRLIAVSACLAISTLARAQQVQTIRYAQDTRDQEMDIHWAAGTPTATVLFIHGGSFQENGERRDSTIYRNVCDPFVAAGITCATMDYRLAPAHHWPDMPNDVVSAFVRLRSEVKRRGGDEKRIFLFGHSSGCHLAAIVATNPAYLSKAKLSTADIAGVIPMGCLLDRDDQTLRKYSVEQIAGHLRRDSQDAATFGTAENYLAANPASFLSDKTPPFLVIAARNERFFPPVMEQGSRVVRMLLEIKVPANLVIVPGRHVTSIADIVKPNDPTFVAIKRFIADPKSVGEVDQ